jgi:hypothetical protein
VNVSNASALFRVINCALAVPTLFFLGYLFKNGRMPIVVMIIILDIFFAVIETVTDFSIHRLTMSK